MAQIIYTKPFFPVCFLFSDRTCKYFHSFLATLPEVAGLTRVAGGYAGRAATFPTFPHKQQAAVNHSRLREKLRMKSQGGPPESSRSPINHVSRERRRKSGRGEVARAVGGATPTGVHPGVGGTPRWMVMTPSRSRLYLTGIYNAAALTQTSDASRGTA